MNHIILVLDDNREILEAVKMRLSRYIRDCTVVTASDGVEGKEILRTQPVDMILTDLSMPIVNGYKLIEHVKTHYPSVPICVMTANCSPDVVRKLQAMGVGRWIEKPFKFENVARMVAEALNLAYNN
jgi:CheY-like chemotaxis protein